MKVLHINAVYRFGSTGMIVEDIHNLSLENGIESYVVSGSVVNTGTHAWNIIKLNNHYFQSNVCWDDSNETHDYFLKCDREIMNDRTGNLYIPSSLYNYVREDLPECLYAMGDVSMDFSFGFMDIAIIINYLVNYSEIENDNLVLADVNYDGRFEDVKRLCEMGCLALYGTSVMMWMFPVKIFNAFRESYILTYMFNAQMQKYYYDFYGMKYKYLYVAGNSVETYSFTQEPQEYKHKYNYKELVTIFDDNKLNMIGDADTALSKAWYIRNKDNNLLKQLKNNTLNFFNNKLIVLNDKNTWVKSKSENNIWTTFKDFKDKISGKGYSKGFVPSNMRATNSYQDRAAIAYLVNKYINPYVKNFFISNNIKVYEDDYAVSEMLQFIWRSAVRQGKHITIYIPSKRMRNLLQNWIDKQEYI
jgi:hypothetical protein